MCIFRSEKSARRFYEPKKIFILLLQNAWKVFRFFHSSFHSAPARQTDCQCSLFSVHFIRIYVIFTDKYGSSPTHYRESASSSGVGGGGVGSGNLAADGRHERRSKSSSVNNCYLSSSSNGGSGAHQSSSQQYQQQKPLSISANNFSPASTHSDSSKIYKSSSHNVTTGGNCDKNYQQQQPHTSQQYNNSSRNSGNNPSTTYSSQSNYDFEHMLNDPNDYNNSSTNQHHQQHLGKQQQQQTASGSSSRSSRSYNPPTNQTSNSDQFQGLCSQKFSFFSVFLLRSLSAIVQSSSNFISLVCAAAILPWNWTVYFAYFSLARVSHRLAYKLLCIVGKKSPTSQSGKSKEKKEEKKIECGDRKVLSSFNDFDVINTMSVFIFQRSPSQSEKKYWESAIIIFGRVKF